LAMRPRNLGPPFPKDLRIRHHDLALPNNSLSRIFTALCSFSRRLTFLKSKEDPETGGCFMT
jgi:hypothetical protein